MKAAWLAVIKNKGNIKRSLTCASDAGSGLLKCKHNVFDIKSLPAHVRKGGFCDICDRMQYIKCEQAVYF